MIILLESDADLAAVRVLVQRLEDLGLRAVPLEGLKGRALEVSGPEVGRALQLRSASGVREILTRRTALTGGDPLWPHTALRAAILAVLLLVALALLVAYLPPGLGDRAEGGSFQDAGGVEWYLRPLAALRGAFPERLQVAGGGLLALAWLALLLWPFLDRADGSTPRGRALVRLVRGAGLLLALAWIAVAAGVLP